MVPIEGSEAELPRVVEVNRRLAPSTSNDHSVYSKPGKVFELLKL